MLCNSLFYVFISGLHISLILASLNGLEIVPSVFLEEIIKTGFISYKINPSDIDTSADDFKALSLDDKKRLLMELIDKNQLYVNYCDIDDETFDISAEDKAFTKSFYGEG